MGNTQDKTEGKTGGPTEVFGKYINPNLAGVCGTPAVESFRTKLKPVKKGVYTN
jgi:hypothetical protein